MSIMREDEILDDFDNEKLEVYSLVPKQSGMTRLLNSIFMLLGCLYVLIINLANLAIDFHVVWVVLSLTSFLVAVHYVLQIRQGYLEYRARYKPKNRLRFIISIVINVIIIIFFSYIILDSFLGSDFVGNSLFGFLAILVFLYSSGLFVFYDVKHIQHLNKIEMEKS